MASSGGGMASSGGGMASSDGGLAAGNASTLHHNEGTRRGVDELLAAIDGSPNELPLEELARLSSQLTTQGLQVQVDRRGRSRTPVVFVAPDRDPVFACLSRRERDVVTLLAGGFSNEQIASTLFVSLATVKGHVHSVFAKTGLSSRTQVVAAWYGGLRSTAESHNP